MAAEPILDGPRVVAGFGERIAAAITQHVGVDGPQSRSRSDALDVAVDGARCERAAALGHKNEGRAGKLAAWVLMNEMWFSNVSIFSQPSKPDKSTNSLIFPCRAGIESTCGVISRKSSVFNFPVL